jgi:threonyl-tRNA synthetase
VEIISGLPADATISLYRCGPMVDLCRGPHLPHSGLLKATAVQAMSRSFWKGDVTREGLQACVCLGSQESTAVLDLR